MNIAMKKAKCNKEFFAKLKETTTAATIIEKSTLNDECKTALNAFKELNPHTRKRKHDNDDAENDSVSNGSNGNDNQDE